MNILLLTNEYPPHIYGGAGVHIEHLSRELAEIEGNHLQILSFGDQKIQLPAMNISGIAPAAKPFSADRGRAKFLDALYRNIIMTGLAESADIIHCHTWYSYLGGCLLKQILGIPLVITTHSLEPHRPWKKEQLGGSYDGVCWLERAAFAAADGIIAVSKAMKEDTEKLFGIAADQVQVIHNGIDAGTFHKIREPQILKHYGIDPDKPYILFVGRITSQKGILHLVNSLPLLKEGLQVVLCAGMPDTERIGREMHEAVRMARTKTANDIIWIEQMVPVPDLIALYSHADIFVCPSVYEPFGIINLEAMACGTPVVAAAVGGIPEVVVHGQTGLLVPFQPRGGGSSEPQDPDGYSRDLAAAVNALMASAGKRSQMGEEGHQRVEALFSWKSIARQTQDFYRSLTLPLAFPR